MPIAADFTVAVNGDIRHASGTDTYTVLELHRFLQDLADDAQATGNDLVDITSDTPSERSTDNIITLLGAFNIDDDAAEYFYAGSITQASGNTVYSGLQVLGAVNSTATQLMVIQDNGLYSFTPSAEIPFWGDQSTGGYNGNTTAGILMRCLIKTRENGADIDGQRIRVQARHWGDTYDFFNVTLGAGESVAAIGTTPDAQNDTAQGTVNGYTHIVNSGTIPVDQQDETSYDNSPTSEGTFSGGTGYANNDVITLSDGSTVVVDNQTATVVDQFTITSTTSRGAVSTDTLTQVSVAPAGGTGFSVTLDTDNVVADPDHPRGGFQLIDLNNGNGNKEYYSKWTFGADTSGDGLKGMWEYIKDVTANGTIPIDAQDETSYDNSPTTEGTFAGGTGHNISDVITLSDGSTATVDNHAGNVVTEFTLDTSTSTGSIHAGQTLTQTGTTGGGAGFSITVDVDNVTAKKSLDAIFGERFLGITHSFAYQTEVGGPFIEHETVVWGTKLWYDNLANGPFTVGNYVTIGANGAAGRVMYDDETDDLIIALEDTSITLLNDDVITEYSGPGQGATTTTAILDTGGGAVEDNGLSGGSGLLLALDDDGTTGNLYIQVLTGSAPADTIPVRGLTSGATAEVNGAPTARTVPKIFLGSYTGSLIGAYGVGVLDTNLTASDTLQALDASNQVPPNNVVFTVSGLVSGEDRVLVGPRNAGILQKNQDTLNGTLTDNVTTAVVMTTAIPSDTPTSGTIRIEDDLGVFVRSPYDSYTGSTYTLSAAFQGTADNNATSGNDVFISYIDKTADADTATFTSVYNTDRDLFVRVRDGGGTPIKTFEAPATLGSSGGSIAAIRTDDA
jgi:hypothetical protein